MLLDGLYVSETEHFQLLPWGTPVITDKMFGCTDVWNRRVTYFKVYCITYTVTFQLVRSFLLSVLKPLLIVNNSRFEALKITVFLCAFSSIPWIQLRKRFA